MHLAQESLDQPIFVATVSATLDNSSIVLRSLKPATFNQTPVRRHGLHTADKVFVLIFMAKHILRWILDRLGHPVAQLPSDDEAFGRISGTEPAISTSSYRF